MLASCCPRVAATSHVHKTNARTSPWQVTKNDRMELAKGCLRVDHLTDDTALVWEVQLNGLCRAAQRANEFCDLPGVTAGEVRKVCACECSSAAPPPPPTHTTLQYHDTTATTHTP